MHTPDQATYEEEDDLDTEVKKVTQRIDITEYVRDFLIALSKREGQRVKVNGHIDALRIQHLLNNPINTAYKSAADMRTGVPYWNEQKVVYYPSNLGQDKGFIFYFVCNVCGGRVKYLYIYSEVKPPLCRKCCRFPYKYKRRKRTKMVSQPHSTSNVGFLI